jgi:hypothetical protein
MTTILTAPGSYIPLADPMSTAPPGAQIFLTLLSALVGFLFAALASRRKASRVGRQHVASGQANVSPPTWGCGVLRRLSSLLPECAGQDWLATHLGFLQDIHRWAERRAYVTSVLLALPKEIVASRVRRPGPDAYVLGRGAESNRTFIFADCGRVSREWHVRAHLRLHLAAQTIQYFAATKGVRSWRQRPRAIHLPTVSYRRLRLDAYSASQSSSRCVTEPSDRTL